jgi:hypothetical protein
MKFTITTHDSEFVSGHLVGYVRTTRRVLEEHFGAPFVPDLDSDGKTTVEWVIKFEDGLTATIYDWKRYEMGTPELDEIEEWHIGGQDEVVTARVLEALETVNA